MPLSLPGSLQRGGCLAHSCLGNGVTTFVWHDRALDSGGLVGDEMKGGG